MPVPDMARPPAQGRPSQDRDAVRAHRRWRRFLRAVALPVQSRGAHEPGDGYGFRLGPLVLFKAATGGARYVRDAALAARSRYRGHVLVLLVLRGQLRGASGELPAELRRGDIGFFDLSHAAEAQSQDASLLGLIVPGDMLRGRIHGLVLRESQLACRMLTRHLEQLVLSLPVEPARAATLVESTMAVAQLCLDFSPATDPEPSADPLRANILGYIDANLDDVELSPERIAREFGISRTRLYQLFLGSGGIKRCIRDKRLDAAFRDLCDAAQPRVIDVAYRRGFSSERQFQ